MHAFDVLGDPVRRRLIELIGGDEVTAGAVTDAVTEEFGITQPAVSRQLRILRESGFAVVRPQGTRRLYSLDRDGFRDVERWMNRVDSFWNTRLDALGTEIARQNRAARRPGASDPHEESTP